MLERVATAHAGANPSSNAGTRLARHCSTTHPSESASHGNVRSHLVGDLHASVRASGIEKKGTIPPLVPSLPCLVGNVDDRDLHRIARRCVGTGGRCSVSGQKHVHPKASASHSDIHSSHDHTRNPCLSFRAYHERTTIPENTSFEWKVLFNASKRHWYGSY